MYLLKNALKSISRSMGRNVLIGIIVFVIALSCCLGLSIRQASETTKETTLEEMSITAQISFDRQAMMNQMLGGEGGFDRSNFKTNMEQMNSLSMEEMKHYATAPSVKTFYYTATLSLNGIEDFEAINSTSTTSSETSSFGREEMGMSGMMSGKGGGFQKGSMGVQGDFTLIGYSSDEAMIDFINGTSTLVEGQMFEEETSALDCVISDELATYNGINVGDEIVISNPNQEEETYTLTVVGIYHNSQSTATNSEVMQGFSSASDPANRLYLSYEGVQAIVEASSESAVVSTDENTGVETTTAIPQQVSGTYVFANVGDYERFEEEVRVLGLEEPYVISSSDLTAYEQRLLPLENLSQMALYFLMVVLGIGAIILIVLNTFNIRERKYEIGVLTAIGMKKGKVALQFVLEGFIVTFIAILIGGAAGTISSVPVTNALLSSQIQSQTQNYEQMQQSFGRPTEAQKPSQTSGRPQKPSATIDYISSVQSATDLEVLIQLLGIGVGLTLLSSAVSIAFIMRYEPLKILSNRD